MELQALIDRYPALLEGAERHRDLGWYPAGGEVQKFEYRPTVEAIDWFGDHLFGGIGFEGRDFAVDERVFGLHRTGVRRPAASAEDLRRHEAQFERHLRAEYHSLKTEHPHRIDDWVALVADVYDFGGISVDLCVDRRRVKTSFHSIRVGRRAIVGSELMQGRPVRTVAEIGGGHGRSLRDFVWTFGVETAFYVDLPLNMVLAARFLGHFFPNRLNLVWSENERPVDGCINIVAPWLIERIDVPVDLLVNFLSFQHMSIEALRFYGDRLIEPRVAALYHQNRDRPREEFDLGLDDYPFRQPFTITDRRDLHTVLGRDSSVLGIAVGELLIR